MYEAGATTVQHLYMGEYHADILIRVVHTYVTGYYIHTCPKMRYKGEYAPSFLLDPVRFPCPLCRAVSFVTHELLAHILARFDFVSSGNI